jgi:hypothetical protein
MRGEYRRLALSLGEIARGREERAPLKRALGA